MAYIEIKSKLRKLKFGEGSAKGPDMQFPMPPLSSEDLTTYSSNLLTNFSIVGNGSSIPASIAEYYKSNRDSRDFPLRGGGLDYNPLTTTFTVAGKIDKERIKKFIDSNPNGSIFLKKQIGLQLSNPNIQTGNNIFNSRITDFPIPAVLQNTKIYNNGINSLAQVGLQGTGTHATRHGVVPINPNAKYYSDIVGAEKLLNNKQVQSKNRLLILNQLKMSNGSSFSIATASNIVEINNLGISRNKLYLFDYLTGPGSVYGIGSTRIRRYDDTRKAAEDWKKNDTTKVRVLPLNIPSYGALTYDDIMSKTASVTNKYSRLSISGSVDRETIYKLNVGSRQGSDAINLAMPKLINSADPWTDSDTINDMIKFGFECISNDDPNLVTFIQFRALLSSGISDSNTAAWNSFKYMGRGEDFYVYQGFSRAITVSFKLAAQSREEMETMYNKLNYLVSQVYPDYSPRTGMMRAPIVKLTIGDYLYRVPGVLDNVNITIDKDASWHTNSNSFFYGKGELPMVLEVAISFKPILSDLPQRSKPKISETSITNTTRDDSRTLLIKETNTTKTAKQSITPLIANNNNVIDSTKYNSLELYNTSYEITSKKPVGFLTEKQAIKSYNTDLVFPAQQMDVDKFVADRQRRATQRKNK